jgi:hypothetical protein
MEPEIETLMTQLIDMVESVNARYWQELTRVVCTLTYDLWSLPERGDKIASEKVDRPTTWARWHLRFTQCIVPVHYLSEKQLTHGYILSSPLPKQASI